MHNAAEKRLTHLQMLEAEAIHIIRQVAAGFDNPCMFYSIGKDSTVMLHLARKAFYPGKVPFPLLHIDTTWEFAEMAQFRDRLAEELDLNVLVHINEEALELGVHPIESGSVKYNDQMKTVALKQALRMLLAEQDLRNMDIKKHSVADLMEKMFLLHLLQL